MKTKLYPKLVITFIACLISSFQLTHAACILSLYSPSNNTSATCHSQLSIYVYANGVQGNVTYTWKLADSTVLPHSVYSYLGYNYSYLNPYISLDSTTTFYVTAKDDSGCTSSTTVKIFLTPGNIYNNFTSSVCPGESFTTYFSGDTAVNFYLWNFDDATQINGQASITKSFSGPGNHHFSLQVKNSCNIDTTLQDSIVVDGNIRFQPGQIPYSISTNNLCPGQVAKFSANYNGLNALKSLKWDFGDTTYSTSPDTFHSYLYKKTDTIKLTLTNYCNVDTVIKDTILVNSTNHIPNGLTITGNHYICPSDNLSFDINGGVYNRQYITGYKWDLGDTITSTAPVILNHVYHYTNDYPLSVVLYDYCGFTDTLKSIVHVKNNLAFPSASFLTINLPSSPLLTGTPMYLSCTPVVDTMSIASYKWLFGNNDSASTANVYRFYNSCVPETIYLSAINYCGLSLNSQLNNISVADTFTSPTLSINVPLKSCPGEVVTFNTNSYGVYAKSYTWIFGDGDTITSNSTAINHIYKSAGKYSIRVILSSYCKKNIVADSSINVGSVGFEDNNVSLMLSNAPLCNKEAYGFFVSSTANLKKYLWNFGDGTKQNGLEVQHIFPSNGSYVVALNLTDFCGNDTVLHDTLVVTNSPSNYNGAYITTSKSMACPNTVINFSASNYPMAYGNGPHMGLEVTQSNWDFGDGSKVTSQSTSAQHSYKDTGEFAFSVKLINACGYYTTLTGSIIIKKGLTFTDVPPYPEWPVYNLLCPGQTGVFSETNGFTNYSWNFGDTIISGDIAFHAFSTPGIHTIALTITNGCGFDTTILHEVEVYNSSSMIDYNLNIKTNHYACPGDSVVIIANGNGKTYNFDFGDSTQYFINNPADNNIIAKHKYADTGMYKITLTETDFCGVSQSVTDIINIEHNAPVMSSYGYPQLSAINDSNCINRYMYFNYLSFEPVNLLNFGDGSPLVSGGGGYNFLSHKYSTPGNYEADLITKNSCGDSVLTSIYITTRACQLSLSAAFTYNINNNTVTFNSPASDSATSWLWQFGDNTSLSGQPATHVYNTTGNYNVCLFTGNNIGDTAKSCQNITISNVVCNAVADFSVVIDTLDLKVYFTDQTSTGLPNKWNWDFGDGTTSTQQNPVHQYKLAGNYSVSLSVSYNNNNCTNNVVKTIQVGVVQCLANFTYTTSNLDVNFTDISKGNLSTYYWDFGDGSYSTAKDTTHTYTKKGIYQVSLTVANSGYACMDKMSAAISVGAISCDAQFTCYVDSSANTVYVKERDASNNTNEFWTFGDGYISTGKSPSHKFDFPGIYTISLNAYNTNGCIDYSEKAVTIGNDEADCQSDFIYQVDSANQNIQFTDKSLGDIKTYFWNFGDFRDTSNSWEPNPNRHYSRSGYYNVCHLVVNKKGISNITCKNVEVSGGCAANFNFMVDQGTKTAYFNDASFGNPDTWLWDFNDQQNTSNTQDANHQYSDNGYYLVSLKSGNSISGCSGKTYKLISVGMNPTNLVAGFGYDADKYNTKADGYPVDFTGAGIGDHARLRWTFGDSTIDTTSTTPRHYYKIADTYYVCYIVSDPVTGKQDSLCKEVQTTGTYIKSIENCDGLSVYPNPFKNKINIKFNVSKGSLVEVTLSDISGRTVATIIRVHKDAGDYSIYWDSPELEKGSYFVQLRTSTGISMSKVLIKQ